MVFKQIVEIVFKESFTIVFLVVPMDLTLFYHSIAPSGHSMDFFIFAFVFRYVWVS